MLFFGFCLILYCLTKLTQTCNYTLFLFRNEEASPIVLEDDASTPSVVRSRCVPSLISNSTVACGTVNPVVTEQVQSTARSCHLSCLTGSDNSTVTEQVLHADNSSNIEGRIQFYC